jgi:hypothetical protein
MLLTSHSIAVVNTVASVLLACVMLLHIRHQSDQITMYKDLLKSIHIGSVQPIHEVTSPEDQHEHAHRATMLTTATASLLNYGGCGQQCVYFIAPTVGPQGPAGASMSNSSLVWLNGNSYNVTFVIGSKDNQSVNLIVGGRMGITITPALNVQLNGGGQLQFPDDHNINYTALQGAASGLVNNTITLPPRNPTAAGQVLASIDVLGNLTWVNQTSAYTPYVYHSNSTIPITTTAAAPVLLNGFTAHPTALGSYYVEFSGGFTTACTSSCPAEVQVFVQLYLNAVPIAETQRQPLVYVNANFGGGPVFTQNLFPSINTATLVNIASIGQTISVYWWTTASGTATTTAITFNVFQL